MTEYTAEDFANARFAEHPDPVAVDARYAARMNRAPEYPWLLDGVPGNGDEHMARDGWRPVQQHNPHATDALEEEVQDLRDKNGDLKMRLGQLHDEIALWQQRASDAEAYARKVEAAPITLDSLRAAWENAEVPTEDAPMRQGDVYISTLDRNDRGLGYFVAAAGSNGTHMHFNARILHRAPEPWQALADVLRTTGCDGQAMEPKILASVLHERGVRVTGGDEA